MLTFIIRDVQGREINLHHPLKVSLMTEDGVPADSLRAVFSVYGNVPALYSAEVYNGQEMLFFGYIDEQTTEWGENGTILTISARSRAAILLDNEARPQTYIKPSMPLLMQRHFTPLGFEKYIGTDKAFAGQLTVVKGMSEWTLLRQFCDMFIQTKPRLHRNGVIDITGADAEEVIMLSKERIISCSRSLRNSVLISDITARTYFGGAYTMPLTGSKAKKLGIRRRRYVDSVDSKSRSVLEAKKIIEQSDAAYERMTVICSGCIFCETGSTLMLPDDRKVYRVREVVYTYDISGEKTRIIAEVKD